MEKVLNKKTLEPILINVMTISTIIYQLLRIEEDFYGNEEEVKAEVDGFRRAHRLSTIKNKLHVNVGTMSAVEVSNIIISFLRRENKITGEPKQLKIFEEEVRMTLKNQTPRVVKIQAMKTYKPDVSHITYQENPF